MTRGLKLELKPNYPEIIVVCKNRMATLMLATLESCLILLSLWQ